MSERQLISSMVSILLLLLLFMGAEAGPAFAQMPRTGATVTPSGKVTSGSREYRRLCAQCHGYTAKGDGPVASELKTPPPDLTVLSKNNGGKFPYQHVYDSISGKEVAKAHGTREMPIYYLTLARPQNPFGTGASIQRSQYQVDLEIKRITEYIKSIQQP
jgi:mono/diheme cytochrome c family protein